MEKWKERSLAADTILNGKYIIINAEKHDSAGIEYKAKTIAENSPVMITEFFPGGAITRNRQNGSAIVMKEGCSSSAFESGMKDFISTKQKEFPDIQDIFNENGTVYLVAESKQNTHGKEKATREKKAPREKKAVSFPDIDFKFTKKEILLCLIAVFLAIAASAAVTRVRAQKAIAAAEVSANALNNYYLEHTEAFASDEISENTVTK